MGSTSRVNSTSGPNGELTYGSGSWRGPRWAMVGAGAALIGTCYGLARFAYGLFAPEFQAEFAISSTIAGVIGSGSYVGYCIAIVASLLLTPRWGPRRVAVLAGVVAIVGITTVAVAPSASVLAVGILVAGSSTGIASPPMAAAVTEWVTHEARDRAQTVVNAGTGLGVLVSGPVALVLLADWRCAWGAFAIIAALVTGWVALTVPSSRSEQHPSEPDPGSGRAAEGGPQSWLVPGAARLIAAAFMMGLSSIAVWTFGRDLVESQPDAGTTLSATVWIVLGTSGVLGALGGDLARRVGLTVCWVAAMLIMGAATALLALAATSTPLILLAAALFGASYIALTGFALIWSTRLYTDRASLGVGLSFFMIAGGQATGAPVVGWLIEVTGPTSLFCAWAGLSLLGAALRPRPGGPGPDRPTNVARGQT